MPGGWSDLAGLAGAAAIGTGAPGSRFVLLDDARDAGASYLFCQPLEIVAATQVAEVADAMAHLRARVAAGYYVAGYIAYEAGYAFEPRLSALPVARTGDPLMWFGVFERATRIDAASELLPRPAATPCAVRPLWTEAGHRRAVGAVRHYIDAGDVYQVNLTFRAALALGADPLRHYARWRRAQRSGWGGVVVHEGRLLLSASPELFVSAQAGELFVKPMKGTAPRDGTTRDEDAIEALRSCAKDRAENLMIVDLMRNDLARVSVAGSVRVPRLFDVETYPTIHQMTSTITARLRPEADVFAALTAMFPCGSITGAPKVRAMEIIAELETEARSAYTGSIGFVAPCGAGTFNVAIRTADVGPRGSRLGLGSAIVADSVAGSEWRECLAKAAFIAARTPGIP